MIDEKYFWSMVRKVYKVSANGHVHKGQNAQRICLDCKKPTTDWYICPGCKIKHKKFGRRAQETTKPVLTYTKGRYD